MKLSHRDCFYLLNPKFFNVFTRSVRFKRHLYLYKDNWTTEIKDLVP